MTSLLLALAITGQSCQLVNGRLVCPQPAATSRVESTWRKVAVRVEAIGSRSTGWGSGVLVASDGTLALVLTNRHVVRGSSRVIVHRGDERYAARVIRVASDGDIAALEIASPINPYSMRIATAPASMGFLSGFDGSTGQFHAHSGRYASSDGPNDSYAYHTHEGESGSAVMNERGELTGIAWGTRMDANESPAVGLTMLRAFLATETCFRFFRRQPKQINVNVVGMSGSPITPVPTPGEVITPLPTPTSPAIPSAPIPPTVVTIPPPPAVDLGPIIARLTAAEQRLSQVEQLAAATAGAVAKPINFMGSDGSFQSAQLGDTVKLKVPTPTPAK